MYMITVINKPRMKSVKFTDFCPFWQNSETVWALFLSSLQWDAQSVIPPRWAVTPPSVCLRGGRRHQVLRAASGVALGSVQHPASARHCEISRLKPLQPVPRLPACLRSVRLQRCGYRSKHAGVQSHKPGLHGWLEAFRATFCPVCLQTPGKIGKQASVNTFFFWHRCYKI